MGNFSCKNAYNSIFDVFKQKNRSPFLSSGKMYVISLGKFLKKGRLLSLLNINKSQL